MQPRFHVLAQVLRRPTSWLASRSSGVALRAPRLVCKSCRSRFSTSSILRKATQALKKAAEKPSQRGYPEKLQIYDAGQLRSTWVSFWKGTALFQFGLFMYIAPIVWKNENEPRVNIRKWQTIAVVIAGILPTITLSYLTAPFVSSIAIRVPTIARGSRDALLRWSSRVPPDTRLELVTLRTWPVRRTSAVFLHELRALDTQRWRYANIGREASNVSEDKKSIWRSFLGIINEPRFKFYVKPGLAYTHRTGVGGVWENVAKIIQEQTWNKDPGGKTGIRRTPARLVTPRVVRNVKRHTARSTK